MTLTGGTLMGPAFAVSHCELMGRRVGWMGATLDGCHPSHCRIVMIVMMMGATLRIVAL